MSKVEGTSSGGRRDWLSMLVITERRDFVIHNLTSAKHEKRDISEPEGGDAKTRTCSENSIRPERSESLNCDTLGML